MDGDELAGLSRAALLELVRRQQEELATHEAAIERRDEKIRELEAGDGAALSEENLLEVKALGDVEILLFDLA